jgi:DNA recombination protein RmuC
MHLVALIFGILAGIALGFLFARARLQPVVARLQAELSHSREDTGRLEAFAGQTLDKAVAAATDRIGVLVKPIEQSLQRVTTEVSELEKARGRDYGALMRGLSTLEQTTGSLATALRSPAVRGRWGELQLRNAVEAAGMLKFCDFLEQQSVAADDGRLRPDMIVRLPGGRQVVVDAKAPVQALLDAEHAADDTEREHRLDDYVRHVRDHVTKLSRKAYWEQFTAAPDFVIMFLPGEGFYRAAIERDPSLIELAPGQRIHIASPTTLITLLRAIAVGWREAEVAENARAIERLGRELYERLATMAGHFTTLGKRLEGSVQAYNQAVGSLERRVLVSARRFVEHGVESDKQVDELAPIETVPQLPQTIELPTRAA